MDEIQQSQIGRLGPGSADSGEPPRKVSRLLLLWPLAGVICLIYDMIGYRPLDDMLIYWIGGAPCIIIALLINIAWRKVQTGADVHAFFPRTVWLAIGCLCLPMLLLANGALDHSPVERHRQIITRTILERGGKSGPSYYLELTSWRPKRTREKVMVSERWYLEAKPGDPAIVETRRGALGIPFLVSVHRPD
jgi:hypothetical protein